VRRTISSVNGRVFVSKTEKTITINHVARMEIDNHADTCCFGANFMPTYFTGKVCEVTPFSEEYDAMTNIQVVGAYTVYDDKETGETYILEFHEGLWFSDKMPHSMINPSLCRAYLGFYDPKADWLGPLEMDGVVYMTTRVPTYQEIDSCPHIVLTSNANWDPLTVSYPKPQSKEEEEYW